MMIDTIEEWFTLKEAAQYLKVSPQTLRRHKANGKLRHTYVGGQLRFKKEDLNAFVEQTTREMQTRYTIKQSPYGGGKTELLNAFRERLRAYQAVRPTTDQQKVAEKYYTLTDEEEKRLWKRLTKAAEREAESDIKEL